MNRVTCLWSAGLLFSAGLFVVMAARSALAEEGEWKLAWHDEFDKDGPPDPSNWDYERGFVRNNELQWYQPENANCKNGLLVIERALLNQAIGGTSGGDPSRLEYPVRLEVDWVRVYQRAQPGR